MKVIFRRSVGMMIAVPFYLMVNIWSLFIGRQRAISFWGPVLRTTVTWMAEITLVPKISSPEEFILFVSKMKRNLSFLRILYDVSIDHEDDKSLILNYHNCPHCQAFYSLGLPELGPYACDSDWDIAKKHAGLWEFEREYQIGTGDACCNHTYRKKKTIPANP